MPHDPKQEALQELRARRQAEDHDWDETKREWLEAVDALCANIADWLEDASRDDLVEVVEASIPVHEHRLGSYSVPSLHILTPGGIGVQVKPVARLTIGGLGRVDLVSGPHRVELLRRGSADWKIVSRKPARLRLLTEKSFFEEFNRRISR